MVIVILLPAGTRTAGCRGNGRFATLDLYDLVTIGVTTTIQSVVGVVSRRYTVLFITGFSDKAVEAARGLAAASARDFIVDAIRTSVTISAIVVMRYVVAVHQLAAPTVGVRGLLGGNHWG